MNTDFTIEFDEYIPLKDLVFRTLKKAIMKGELQQGEHLIEVQLSEIMGVSRTPIREAIQRLSEEGLVTLIPRHGAIVAGISGKMLTDVLQVRNNLEKMALSLAFDNMGESAVNSLVKHHTEFSDAVKSGDIMCMTIADEGFHSVIYKASGNRKLEEILENLRDSMFRYRLEYLRYPELRESMINEHAEIIESIRNHDLQKGLTTLEGHIFNQEKAILLNLGKTSEHKGSTDLK